MVLILKDLKSLPVYTKSGFFLGKIKEAEVDSETQQITKYFVRSGNPLKNVLAEELIISANQVISLSKEKMVVDDNVSRVSEGALVKEPAAG